MYLIGQSRSCRPQGTLICGTFSHCATLLVSSCSAPNGQSQPQNGPRPQNSSAAATAAQRMKISGAARKNSQLKSVMQRVREGQHVDDRELGVGVPAEPDEREGQVGAPHPDVELRAADQRVLEEEDRGEDQERDGGDADRDRVRLPDLDPERLLDLAGRERVRVVQRRPAVLAGPCVGGRLRLRWRSGARRGGCSMRRYWSGSV